MNHQSHNKKENCNKESPPEYETTDFYLASYLRSKGYSIASLGRPGNRTIFKFGDKPEREKKFWLTTTAKKWFPLFPSFLR